MSTSDFGLRDAPLKQKPPKFAGLFFTRMLGLFATFVGIVSILGILLALYSMFLQSDGGNNVWSGLSTDSAISVLLISISLLSGAAVVGTLAEISENLKVAAQSLLERTG
ncbi:hypothetical protein ACLGGT_10940 [Roseovarius sp. MS2]|uniref:hypothetical protein n=1 Tax=Roseovarius sp. MS2 TaxID=3390728 RepID=UPI003EDC2742